MKNAECGKPVASVGINGHSAFCTPHFAFKLVARHGTAHEAAYLDARRAAPKFLEPEEARALLAATPESYNDMVLAALARQHKLTVLTTDWDFDALADLRVENWAK